MNQKPILLAIVFAALLVIGGVFWVMQKHPVAVNQLVATDPVAETPVQTESENPIDTSDWKTYRNEEYGFEFKYSESFAHPVPGEIYEGTKLRDSSFNVNGGGHFEYDVWENPNRLTATELMQQKYQGSGWRGGSLVTIDHSTGTYFRGLRDDGVCLIEVNMFPDTRVFHVIRIEICNVEKRSEKMDTFHDILSTVQY